MLTDVLLVPKLRYSLFSVGAALKKGYTLAGSKDSIALLKDGVKVLIGKENNNLFSMGIRFAGRLGQAAMTCSAGKGSMLVWHHRLGHICEATLKRMLSGNIVTGMDGPAEGTLGLCEGCLYGRMTRKPFKSTEWRQCAAGEIIHFDIMGPMPVESMGKKHYCLVFKDEATSIRRLFFLRHKSEALTCFKFFLKEIEVDFAGKRTRVLKCDNAKEFISRQFADFLLEEGIAQELSPPRSPQSNGFVERENRTLMERARSMLKGAGMPDNLWAEALSTAALIMNRVPTSRHKDTTPYEMWYGEKPDLSHLRAFGCVTFFKDLSRQGKLDAMAKKGFLVGYSPRCKSIYRIYDQVCRQSVRDSGSQV